MKNISVVALALGSLALGGCVTTGGGTTYSTVNSGSGYQQSTYAAVRQARATITNIQVVREEQQLGGGAVAGAVIGGLLGSQVGRGGGNAVATIAGAAAGGYVGHQMEKGQGNGSAEALLLSLRFPDGSHGSVRVSRSSSVRVGEKITVYVHPDGTVRTTP